MGAKIVNLPAGAGFDAGAIVRLKSGGPNMLVVRSSKAETAVLYFDGQAIRFTPFATVTLDSVLEAGRP